MQRCQHGRWRNPVCSSEQEVTDAGKGADRQKENDMQQKSAARRPKTTGRMHRTTPHRPPRCKTTWPRCSHCEREHEIAADTVAVTTAVLNASATPTVSSPAPGRAMKSTPVNPAIAATQPTIPMFSMQDRTRHYDNQYWPEENYRAGLGDGHALQRERKEQRRSCEACRPYQDHSSPPRLDKPAARCGSQQDHHQ